MSKFPGLIFITLGIAFLAAGVFCLQKTKQERELKTLLNEKAALPAELHKAGHARAEQHLKWEMRAKITRTVACVGMSLLLFTAGVLVVKVSFHGDKGPSGGTGGGTVPTDTQKTTSKRPRKVSSKVHAPTASGHKAAA